MTEEIKSKEGIDSVSLCEGQKFFILVKSQAFFELNSKTDEVVKQLKVVLPVMSRSDMKVPFVNCEQMLAYNEGKDLELLNKKT